MGIGATGSNVPTQAHDAPVRAVLEVPLRDVAVPRSPDEPTVWRRVLHHVPAAVPGLDSEVLTTVRIEDFECSVAHRSNQSVGTSDERWLQSGRPVRKA